MTDIKTGLTDELSWDIQPRTAVINGVHFAGFGYVYRFKSEKNPLMSIQDVFSWAPGGTIENDWILESGHAHSYMVKKKLTVAGDLEWKECKDPAYNVYPQLYDLRYPSVLFNYTHFDFRFQYGDNGLIFAYNDHPVYGIRTILKPAGSPAIRYAHRYMYSWENAAETPEMIVLFSPDLRQPTPLGVEDWHGIIYDYVHNKRCEYYGVKPPEMLTMAAKGWMYLYGPNDIQGNERYLDKFSAWGFQAIWWKGWEDNHDDRRLGSIDCLMNLRPGAAFGGEDATREFCDYAHKLGMKVMCWGPTFYTGGRSFIAAQHKDWLLRDSDGEYHQKRFYSSAENVKSYGAYSELIVYNPRSGYREAFLKIYQHLRDLGIDGAWMDSYPNNTIDCVGYLSADHPVYDISSAFKLTAEMMKMGLWIGYEGSGPLGIPAGGSVSPIIDNRLFGYQRIYGWQKLFWARGYVPENELTRNYYYMSCANKSPAAIVASAADKPIDPTCPQKLADWIIQANKDYKAAYPTMQYRHMLPSATDADQEKAVEWTNDENKVMSLWAYDSFEYAVPPGRRVTDVTSGRPVEAAGGKFVTEPWHTYLLSK